MRLVITTVAIVFLTVSAMAQQPYAGLQSRSIKTLSEQQISDLMLDAAWALRLPPS